MKNFVSCVRFESKGECLEVLEGRLKEFKLPKGADAHTVVKTGECTFCTFIHWDSENDLVNARPEMISYLDSIREFLVELSPELGVTDPVSGPVLHIKNR